MYKSRRRGMSCIFLQKDPPTTDIQMTSMFDVLQAQIGGYPSAYAANGTTGHNEYLTVLDDGRNKTSVSDRETMRGQPGNAFGFYLSDISSWGGVVRTLNRPTHPCTLAVVRVLYGLVMTWDLIDERGLYRVLQLWDDPYRCMYPLHNFLYPPAVEWMTVLYVIMLIGILGMTVGLHYHKSCVAFLLPFLYIYAQDMLKWNNHTTFSICIGFLLAISDANRTWSIDGLRQPDIQHSHVPLWSYYLLRQQVFILYFITSLKKLEPDWMMGYSQNLADLWPFTPFRLVFGVNFVNYWFIHLGGFIFDGVIGFLLFFDRTRVLGFVFGFGFHFMNNFCFRYLGMFAYMGVVTLLVFCHGDGPLHLFNKLPGFIRRCLPRDDPPQPSLHCVYSKADIHATKESCETDTEGGNHPKISLINMRDKIKWRHSFVTLFVVFYTLQQIFTPYSHFITKGNNGWRSGVAGYSWDMMVHSQYIQHFVIKYRVRHTGEEGYINTEAVYQRSNRWNSVPAMLKKHALCVESRLSENNITDVEIFYNMWKSKNMRFIQRSVESDIDILTAPWNLYVNTPWFTPMLSSMSHWRPTLARIKKQVIEKNNDEQIYFVADFPGKHLHHVMRNELSNVRITCIEGEITVECVDKNQTVILGVLKTFNVSECRVHKVHVTSQRPAAYYYTFKDTPQRDNTISELLEELRIEQGVKHVKDVDVNTLQRHNTMTMTLKKKVDNQCAATTSGTEFVLHELRARLRLVKHSVRNVVAAFMSIVSGRTMSDIIHDMQGTKPRLDAITAPLFLTFNNSQHFL